MYLTLPAVLAVGISPNVRSKLELSASDVGVSVEFVDSGEELRLRSNRKYAALVASSSAGDGLSINRIRESFPSLPAILLRLSEDFFADDDAAVVVTVPFERDDLRQAFRAVLQPTGKRRGNGVGETMAGSWSRNIELLNRKIAKADLPVLVQGETGVGKEVLARWLHANSSRAGKPFVKLNCAALPYELIESELFGVVKGAFTGALRSTEGKFELAQHGTIFLDEIGEMDLRLQAKLLQVAQDKEFMRVGGRDTIKVDVRIIAATHCDLERAVDEGRFREDLYYRLNVVTVTIPPLRDRVDEIIPLAWHFMKLHGTEECELEIPASLERTLIEHTWPGNVRELENAIRRYLVVGDAEELGRELRRSRNRAGGPVMPKKGIHSVSAPSHLSSSGGLRQVKESHRAAEAEAILKALSEAKWNRREAASLLEVDYKALLYRMKKLNIA